MSSFVNHGSYIIHLSGSIHKNERNFSFIQRILITARCFSLPRFDIKMPHSTHDSDIIGKFCVYFFKA